MTVSKSRLTKGEIGYYLDERNDPTQDLDRVVEFVANKETHLYANFFIPHIYLYRSLLPEHGLY